MKTERAHRVRQQPVGGALPLLVALLCWLAGTAAAGCSDVRGGDGPAAVAEWLDVAILFDQSLHYTGRGLREAYGREGGFGSLVGVPYDTLACKACHTTSCSRCHGQDNPSPAGDDATLHRNETCFSCHRGQEAAWRTGEAQGRPDVHAAAGFSCSRCHHGHDVHGDGTPYVGMRQSGAVRARCTDCHTPDAVDAPPYNPASLSHEVHGGGLACTACHVQSTQSCYNCHFAGYASSGSREGNYIPNSSWLLLVNYENQVTAGTAQVVVYDGKPYVGYGPYFTHSVGRGRTCRDCHANDAVTRIERGDRVPMSGMEGSEPVFWRGVVPAVPGSLDWLFLEKTGNEWAPLDDPPLPVTSWFGHGSAITGEQLDRLMIPLEMR